MKMEVIGKPITQWYDLEGEFDYNVPMLIFEKTKLQTIIQQEQNYEKRQKLYI